MKTLVVYHSRSGYTRRLAESLARRLDADLEEIVTEVPRDGPQGYVRCAMESMLHLRAGIRATQHDPGAYERVVIGGPVWFWGLSSPVRSWLMKQRHRLPQVAFFCTMGGSGAERVFAAMQEITARRPLATLALTDGDIDKHRHGAVDRFVHALTAPVRPAARTASRHRKSARHGVAHAS
jgi:menaquinone-dependent protoporphyrinogen IX oxidase